VKGFSVFIHLVGVAHPGPKKAEQFRTIDLRSAEEAVKAAVYGGTEHFILMSVAQTPTSIMQAYQQARAEAEHAVVQSGITYTFVRPWYIIGPGHYWPLLFQPLFKVLQLVPSTSAKARSLSLVYLAQIIRVFTDAVEHKPQRHRIIGIDEIRRY
jgi:uncharacterized protein YbjT (DUF2867 family)